MFTVVTDTDATPMPPVSDTAYTLKQLHELTIKLECAQQENGIIRLEKLELEKEINQVKHQNEELVQENESYLESSQMEQQEISFLRSLSMNVNQVTLDNVGLNMKLSEYRELIKKLSLKNGNLQKENEKYKIILEELNESKQKRAEIHINNTLNLENKIKDLQNECDALKQEISTLNDINTMNTLRIPSYSRPTSAKYKESNDVFRVKNEWNTPFFPELGNKRNSVQSEREIMSNNDIINDNDECHDIMDQLVQFGYTEHDINTAINSIHHKMDINEIVGIIENNIDCKCHQYSQEIQLKIAEIKRLKVMNKDNKCIIKALQKRIRFLSQQNEKLISLKKRNTNNRCHIFNWF